MSARTASIVGGLPEDIDVVFYGGTFEGAPLLRALRKGGRDHLFAAGDGCWNVPTFLNRRATWQKREKVCSSSPRRYQPIIPGDQARWRIAIVPASARSWRVPRAFRACES
jgi:hypothetical protein